MYMQLCSNQSRRSDVLRLPCMTGCDEALLHLRIRCVSPLRLRLWRRVGVGELSSTIGSATLSLAVRTVPALRERR